MAKHYLFAMWEGGGNVPPLLGVARRLIARGHRVTVLGDPTIEDEARRTGCGFEPWRRAPHRTTLRPEDDLLRDWETNSPFTQLSNYRDKLITEPAARYAADTLDALDGTSADVLVSEYTIFGRRFQQHVPRPRARAAQRGRGSRQLARQSAGHAWRNAAGARGTVNGLGSRGALGTAS